MQTVIQHVWGGTQDFTFPADTIGRQNCTSSRKGLD